MCGISMFFFFKQKTAYGLRISDWSSDVCSSDLHSLFGVPFLCLTLPVSTSLPGAQAPGFSFALRDPFGLARRSRPGRRRPSLCSADHSPTWSISHGPQTDKAPHAQERRPSRAAHRGATQAQGQRARRVEEAGERSEEHTSELQSLMRNSYAVFCLKK